jgi:tetratricopeptide (TPR) repeat protein
MCRRTLLLAFLFVAVPGLSRDKVENWVEVRSEHFVVNTNSSEKKARQIADQFERMRSVFHVAFPKLQIDPPAPIVVLALKDEKDFRALEPAAYLAKGQVKLAGLFLRAPEKNYVLMRLDTEGEHPYEVVYHEYTHLLLSKSAEWMPLWLNEGLAEFYQNTDIHDKDVSLGQPSADNILFLRQNRLLPLPTLFTVDAKSPYYHEEDKGSIFYAESWALTHYLQFKDFREQSHEISDYNALLVEGIDPVTAATRAFGDLNRLQDALDRYVHGQSGFSFFKMKAATEIDDSAFKARPLTASESDALQADFLAYNQRTAEARSLLDRVLKDDPKNVSAHETMGYLEFRDGHVDKARTWYAQAVQLDSQSYLAHYYFAAMSLSGTQLAQGESPDDAKIESSLRSSIKLNPSFAPAYDLLAVFLGSRERNLDEADRMGLTAVSLEPANVHFRVNVAHVLLEMQQATNAVRVLEVALKMAKSPDEIQEVDQMLSSAQAYAAQQKEIEERRHTIADARPGGAPGAAVEVTASVEGPSLTRRDTFVSKGPHRFLTGTLKNVHCNNPQLDLTVTTGAKNLALHSENYYKIQFSALNSTPSTDLNPCKDLEGRTAKVEYVESSDQPATARVLSIELHK